MTAVRAGAGDVVWAAESGRVAVALVLGERGRVRVRVYTPRGYAEMSPADAVEMFRQLAPPGFAERSAGAADVVAGSDPDGPDRPGAVI